MANEEEEDLSPQEIKEDLKASIKLTRKQFFGFIPKGSLGQFVFELDKTARDHAVLALRKEKGGGTPLMGTCEGGVNEKEFVLDKKYDKLEQLCAQMTLVLKKSTGVAIKATVKVKGQKDEPKK